MEIAVPTSLDAGEKKAGGRAGRVPPMLGKLCVHVAEFLPPGDSWKKEGDLLFFIMAFSSRGAVLYEYFTFTFLRLKIL
jgi:hypothetical protein